MPIRFVIDEDSRGILWTAIRSHNRLGIHPLDAVRVGDLPDLPLRTPDPAILAWSEGADRVLLTRDESTMPGHLANHLRAGRHSPGVLVVRERPLAEIIEALMLVAHASEPAEWRDRLDYIP